jgi:hypothetical protein
MSSLFEAVDKVFESDRIVTDAEKRKEQRIQKLKEAVENKRKEKELMKLTEAGKAEKANLVESDKGE